MKSSFHALLKKDFRLMLAARFFLLAAGSLLLYSLYINLVYVKLDDEIFPVYCYDPGSTQSSDPGAAQDEILVQNSAAGNSSAYDGSADSSTEQMPENTLPPVINVSTKEELFEACKDGYSVGIDLSGRAPQIQMVSCGIDTIDNLRASYAVSRLLSEDTVQPDDVISGRVNVDPALTDPSFSSAAAAPAAIIGKNDRESRSRREISAEFLFFELAAVGFLGLAAMLFKEKEMGVIRVHAILPVRRNTFILSKLGLILLSDLLFSTLLTLINLGLAEGLAVLPLVLVQAGILSLMMALTGFFCAIALPDFKQFSLLYLVLAVFITTPVFMAGQMGLEIGWMKFHPMYHLFIAMKNAYFQVPTDSILYYAVCAGTVLLLFLLARWGLQREMEREG